MELKRLSQYAIRPLAEPDRDWVRQFMIEHWGDELMVVHGMVLRPHEFPGFVALGGGQPVGLLTYRIDRRECEVLSLDSLREGVGVSSALIAAAVEAARAAGCARLYLITTNDNLNALRFYQKRGFVLAALRPNALAEARKIKPSISLIGIDGIPLRDELELEMRL
jgi:ribosomal protein S18 acetylase RimI-like enzyme